MGRKKSQTPETIDINNLKFYFGIPHAHCAFSTGIGTPLEAFDYALTDYATFVPYIYGRFMLGNKVRSKKEIQILKDLYCLAIEDIQNYDMIVYVPREFGYVQDGVRWQAEDVALQIDEAILSFLKSENVNYIEVKGSTKDRARQILELLDVEYKETLQLNEDK